MRMLMLPAVVSLAALPCFAQLPDPGTRVRIGARGILAGQVVGTVNHTTDGSLVVVDEKGGPVTVPINGLTSIEVSRGRSASHGALKGALWGAGLGAAVGLPFAFRPEPSNNTWWEPTTGTKLVAWTTASGVAIGASLGAVFGSEQWERVKLPARIAVVPTGRGLALRFDVVR